MALRWASEDGRRARAGRTVLASAGLLGVVLLGAAHGAEWGLVDPGRTTMTEVRAHHGAPTRATTQKVDGYEAAQWTYEGAQAPAGMTSMTVDFGLLSEGRYRADVVRSLLLAPKPGVFTKSQVLTGWGQPSGVGQQAGSPAFMYEEGLFVHFDGAGEQARSMLFTPRQKMPPPTDAPPR